MGLGSAVDGVTNTAKSAFSTVMGYIPKAAFLGTILTATALLTGGGSTALAAVAAASPGTAAAANFGATEVVGGLLKEGLVEGAGHIQNLAGMAAKLG